MMDYRTETKVTCEETRVPDEEVYFGMSDASMYLGISSQTVRHLALKGLLPSTVTARGHRIFKLSDLKAYRAWRSEYMTTTEASHYLGVSVQKFAQLVKDGKIPFHILPNTRRRLFAREDLKQLRESLSERAKKYRARMRKFIQERGQVSESTKNLP
jgi:excisionase family DNA binding protein